VFSLDAATGCTHWSFTAKAGVRTAISVGRLDAAVPQTFGAYFADEQGYIYALDAETGRALWEKKLDDHRFARVIGAPALHAGRLYVPESSPEEAIAQNPRYGCCTFRGSVTALDATSGERIWKTFVIAEEPKPFRTNSAGTQLYGPAGAGIWSSPTIDGKRNLIYVGTGNSYTEVATTGSDAIVAMDLKTGAIRWSNQLTSDDAFIVGCEQRAPGNSCPAVLGPDFDFGASPILRSLPDGRQLILAAQKSGMVYALDPDAGGKVVWHVSVGQGTALGGIEWGAAADDDAVYVPISDVIPRRGRTAGGLTALRIATGQTLWHAPAPSPDCGDDRRRCTAAQSAAATVIPGVVFSGSQDGHLRAYATRDGSLVWDYDTKRSYDTVNGVPARGGSLDTAGPTVANGMLFANSGYGKFFGMPGNVLLAFTPDGR
jgi:polyvinyl alcohol dehydrogenase (cytochrome)